MSSWIALTIELKNHEEFWNEHEEGVSTGSQNTFNEYAREEGLQFFSGTSEATNYRSETDSYHDYLMLIIGGRHDEDEVFEFVEQVENYSTGRFVLVESNDTSDTGTAFYYVKQDDGWHQADRYVEKQLYSGNHLGMKSAAYMYATYGIPAIAKRHMTHEHGETDEYSSQTIHNRPR